MGELFALCFYISIAIKKLPECLKAASSVIKLFNMIVITAIPLNKFILVSIAFQLALYARKL